MSNLGQRIRCRREELGLTQKQVAAKAGIKQQSYQAIESGLVKKPRFLYEISVVLKCDINWLLEGGTKNNIEPVDVINAKRIPIISYLQAGLWTESCDMENSTGYECVYTDMNISNKVFALKIKGISMQPVFLEGDLIIIDPDVEPVPGDFVAAINSDEEATFKKYRQIGYDEYERMQFELVPLNPDYPSMSSLKQQIRILGTMIEHRRYRNK